MSGLSRPGLALLCLLALSGPLLAEGKKKAAEQAVLEMPEPPLINPRYLLVGPRGQAVTHEDFRGRFQLVAFGYTYCPDICPTTLVEMAGILNLLAGQAERLQPLFISLDPERDTPAVLKTYTAFFDPRIIGLTGSPDLVKRAAQNFRVRYAKVPHLGGDPAHYAVDHSAGLYLLGPDGQLIRKFPFGRDVPSMAADILNFINER